MKVIVMDSGRGKNMNNARRLQKEQAVIIYGRSILMNFIGTMT
jgi:hypothetical protein